MEFKIRLEKLKPWDINVATLDGRGCRLHSVIADLGSEVVMDLPLGKLVCDLNTRVSGMSGGTVVWTHQ